MKYFLSVFLCFILAALAPAADYAAFNYTGKIKVQGQNFDGTGQFKLAIVNNPANVTLWSNDGTSSGGGEPASFITTQVNNGVVNILVGDPSAGMDPINRTVFNHPNQIKLRVWFNDGTLGFQHLLPDMNLVNVELLGQETGTEDLFLYVDAATGSDENDGLTTNTAKLTIQAAVDVLPSKIDSNATIKVFPGTYREEVLIYGLSVHPRKSLRILGDEDWVPGSASAPTVRISGTDDDLTGSIDRISCIEIHNASGFLFTGFQVDHATKGVRIVNSAGTLKNLFMTNNNVGMFTQAAILNIIDCEASGNTGNGIDLRAQSAVQMFGAVCNNNGDRGFNLLESSRASVLGTGEFNGNAQHGAVAAMNSWIDFRPDYTGQIQNNGGHGLHLAYESFARRHTLISFSGNGLGDVSTSYNSFTYDP